MGEISEHLLKRLFKAQKPNEKWLTDVTELKGSDGKLYLSPILDLFNREIVAYAMSRNANSEMVKEMLEKAGSLQACAEEIETLLLEKLEQWEMLEGKQNGG